MTSSVKKITLVGALVLLVLIPSTNVIAEETDFKMAHDVKPIFTFTFRDGIEIHEFPVFKMGENMIDNSGVSFTVEGIVGNAPYLHKALDESFKYRLMKSTSGSSFEYNYKYFDVDVDFVKNNQSILSLNYYNCEIQDYKVKTLNDDYESYLSSKTGFAIIDDIEFHCSGLNGYAFPSVYDTATKTISEFHAPDYKTANDLRTFITFEFDGGIEKIEFPYFELISGFEEKEDNVDAQFEVEGIVSNYPMLWNTIDKARKVAGGSFAFNTDFDAKVEFVQDGKVLRALNFNDCRVSEAQITTQTDKEEGFTGKSGFALVNQIKFLCAGLFPVNDAYDSLFGDKPVWQTNFLINKQSMHEFPTSGNLHALATFTYSNGQEIVDFPIFEQGNLLTRSNPTFELTGIVGNTPLLYESADENLLIQSQSGTNPVLDLFQVDIALMSDDNVVRIFNYADCRVIDYVIKSQRDKEESYFKGFALSNTFEFECQGYHPQNPIYEQMHQSFETTKALSSIDYNNNGNRYITPQ